MKHSYLNSLSESEMEALDVIIVKLSMFTQFERYKILQALREHRPHWYRSGTPEEA